MTMPPRPAGGPQRSAVLGTLVAHVLEELRHMGSLPPALSSREVQSALASGAELPTDCFAQLYKTATAALATQLGKDGGRVPFTTLDTEFLCRSLITCRNLEDALRRAVDFCTLIAPRGGELALEQHGATATLFVHFPVTHSNPAAHLVELTSLFSYQQLFSWLIGEPLLLKNVWLHHSGSRDAAPFLHLFNAPASVGRARAGLEFDAAQLAHLVVRKPADLDGLLANYPFHLLGGDAGALSTAQQVRAFLNAALAQQQPLPGSADIAQILDISDTTLRRRLREEGTSYLALREQSLREAAEYQLRHTDRDIEQIAGALGFSDGTAFRRAFHRWTGQAPSKLRRAAAGG